MPHVMASTRVVGNPSYMEGSKRIELSAISLYMFVEYSWKKTVVRLFLFFICSSVSFSGPAPYRCNPQSGCLVSISFQCGRNGTRPFCSLNLAGMITLLFRQLDIGPSYFFFGLGMTIAPCPVKYYLSRGLFLAKPPRAPRGYSECILATFASLRGATRPSRNCA